jgi:hypothetical protein
MRIDAATIVVDHMFGFFSKTVAIPFLDADTGHKIGASELPLDQLPDSFWIRSSASRTASTSSFAPSGQPEPSSRKQSG